MIHDTISSPYPAGPVRQPALPQQQSTVSSPSQNDYAIGEDVFQKIETASKEEKEALPSLPSSEEVEADFDMAALPAAPPPSLKRPVLFVHGFNSSERGFKMLKKYLTSGETPVNTYGGLLNPGNRDELRSDGKVFEIRFSKPWSPVDKNAKELKDAVEKICTVTGASEIDLVTHSMGGLDARSYLMSSDEKIHRLVMVAPPNHGSFSANVELHLRLEHGIPIKPPTENPEVVTTLQMLSQVKEGDTDPANKFLFGLNRGWETQKSRADITIITGVGVPTMVPGGITFKGDDMVTEESARMPGVEFHSIYGPLKARHGKILKDPGVQELIAQALVKDDR